MMGDVRLEDVLGVTEAEVDEVVRRVCRQWRCPDFDDVRQDVLLHILAKHREDPTYFRNPDQVLGTVHTDAWRVIARRTKVARRVKYEPSDPSSLPEAGTSFEEQQWGRLRALAADCDGMVRLIADATKAVREVLLLLCNGMSRKEVAGRLGISVATVWRRWTDAAGA